VKQVHVVKAIKGKEEDCIIVGRYYELEWVKFSWVKIIISS